MAAVREVTTHPFNPVSAPDFLPPAQLRVLQLQRLQAIVRRAYECVEFFRNLMHVRGVTPDAVQTLEDIVRLPLYTKDDLRLTYPRGLFASPMEEIVRLHASSGTTGKPIVVAYTREDIEVWSNVTVRSLAAYGLCHHDIIQVGYGYGMFTGGLGLHYGAEALGATVIPSSVGNTDRQLMILRDFDVTAFCCTPSYFLRLIERAEEMGIDLRATALKVGVFGAEPWTQGMRLHIENAAGIKAYDIYGLTEIIGPGVAAECACQEGLHIFEDYFYPEILDPVTLEPLPDGEEGELVITALSRRAMPMIRYRTRDITALIPEPCACGRTIRRMRRVNRRSDDMLIVRGVNLFPSQIEAALLAVEGVLPHYRIVLSRKGALDDMEVQVEVTSSVFSDKVRTLEVLQDRIVHAIEQTTGLRVHVRLVQPNTLERSEGKAKRVIDQRHPAQEGRQP